MRSSGILQLLGIRPGEYTQVMNLAIVKFLSGLAESIFFIAAVSIFVGQSDITNYWQVLLASGIFYVGYTFLIKRVSRLYPIKLVFSFISYLNILLVAVLAAAFIVFKADGVGIYAFIGFFVFSINSNVLSWDLTSIGYNLQGNKELGESLDLLDIIASLLGFMGVPLFIQVFELEYLFIVILSLTLVYNLFLNKCLKSRVVHAYELRSYVEKTTSRVLSRLRFENKYIFWVILFACFAAVASTVIHYLFLSQVKIQHLTTYNIAVFLGTFYSFGKGATIIYEIYWYSKNNQTNSVKLQLISYPVYLIVGTVLVLGIYFITSNSSVLPYSIGTLMLLNMILFDGVARRMFIDLLTPIRKERLTEGFNNLKGLGEGFALIFSAGLILILGSQSLYFFYAIIGFSLIWVLTLHFGLGSFYNNIIYAFDNRIEGLEHITLTSKTLKSKVDDIIEKNDVNDLSFVYSLLATNSKSEVLKRIFDLEGESFILFCLSEYINNPEFEVDLLKVKKLLTNDSELIRAYAFQLYSGSYDNPQSLIYFFENEVDAVKEAIVTGMLKSKRIEQVIVGGNLLDKLLKYPETVSQAISVIGNVGNSDFYRPLLNIFRTEDKEHTVLALNAAASIYNERLIPALMAFLGDVQFGKSAINALEQYGDHTIAVLINQLEARASDKLFLLHCIDLCSRIETSLSKRFLKKLLSHQSQSVFFKSLQGLNKVNYHVLGKSGVLVKDLIKKELELNLYIMQSMFVLDNTKKYKNTVHALSQEYKLSQMKIIYMISFVLNRQVADKIKEGINLKNDLSRNAFHKDLSAQLSDKYYKSEVLTVLDSSIPFDQKIKKLEAKNHQVMVTEDSICDTILYHADQKFNSWTLASLIVDLGIDKVDTEKLQKTDTSIIKQLIDMKDSNTLINFDKIQLLRSTDIFSQTPEHALLDLADILEEVKYKDQEVIFNKGDLGYYMYLIYRGNVRIDDLGREITTFGPNDFFGELSLLDPEPRSASAIAIGDVTLFKLEREPFYDIMSNRTEVTKGIMKVLCRRIRTQNDNNG